MGESPNITPQAVAPAPSCPVPILDAPVEETIRRVVNVILEHYTLLHKKPATAAEKSTALLTTVEQETKGLIASYRRDILRTALTDMEAGKHPGNRYWLHNAVAKIQGAASDTDKETACEVLRARLKEVEVACQAEDELNAADKGLVGVVARLDPKARTLIAMLLEIATVDEVSEIDWPNELIQETILDGDNIMEGCRMFWDDPDIKTVFRVYRLAQKITGHDEGGTDEPPTLGPAGSDGGGGLEVIQKIVNGESTAKVAQETAPPTTGISTLDDLLRQTPYEGLAAAYAGIRLMMINNNLGDKIEDYCRAQVEKFRDDATVPNDAGGEEAADVRAWLSFVDGAEAGAGQ